MCSSMSHVWYSGWQEVTHCPLWSVCPWWVLSLHLEVPSTRPWLALVGLPSCLKWWLVRDLCPTAEARRLVSLVQCGIQVISGPSLPSHSVEQCPLFLWPQWAMVRAGGVLSSKLGGHRNGLLTSPGLPAGLLCL